MIATTDVNSPLARSSRTDTVIQRLSEIVCANGPTLLTVGMPNLEANEAILACVEKLVRQRDLADKILELLPCFNVGMSFLSEERVANLVEEYQDARNG